METQTILFDRTWFTPASARRWAREHGFRDVVNLTGPKLRARQANPNDFRPGSFRTKAIRPGVKLVVAEPQESSSRRTRRAKSGAGQDGVWRRVYRVGRATFYVEQRAEERSRATGARVRPGWKRVR